MKIRGVEQKGGHVTNKEVGLSTYDKPSNNEPKPIVKPPEPKPIATPQKSEQSQ